MTVSALFGFNQFPFLVSDTLVTTPGKPLTRPASATQEDWNKGVVTPLIRKSYLLGDDTAVAFSGEVNAFRDALMSVKGLYEYFRDEQDAGARLKAHFDQYIPHIDWIGVRTFRIGEMDKFDPKPSGLHFIDSSLKDCCAIGSGAEELRDYMLRPTSAVFEHLPADAHPIKRLHQINASRFFRERIRKGVKDEHWGAPLECVHFNHDTRKLERGPSTLYVRLGVFEFDGKCRLAPDLQLIAYQPGEKFGIVAVFENIGIGASLSYWTLEEVDFSEKTFLEPVGLHDWSFDEIVVSFIRIDKACPAWHLPLGLSMSRKVCLVERGGWYEFSGLSDIVDGIRQSLPDHLQWDSQHLDRAYALVADESDPKGKIVLL